MSSRFDRLVEMLEKQPDDSFLQHALALEHVKMGELLKAKQGFQGLLLRDPEYVGSYLHLGKVLEDLREAEAAVTCYRKGIEVAAKVKDQRAQNELRAALEELEE